MTKDKRLKPKLSYHHRYGWSRIVVVEPLEDDEGFQIWCCQLVPTSQMSEHPEWEDIVGLPNGKFVAWEWTAVGDPIETYTEAKEQALNHWYNQDRSIKFE